MRDPAVPSPTTNPAPRRAELPNRGRRRSTEQTRTSSVLAAAVAHELNNTLLVAAMLVESPTSPDALDPRLAPLIRQSQSLSAIFVGLAASPDASARRRIDLTPWLRDRAADLACTSPRSIRVACELPHAPVHAYADPIALDQVLSTLTSNAIEAMNSQGDLSLQLSAPTHASSPIELRVSDTGPGVEPALRERIFDRGFSTRDSSRPRGLGLAFARQLIELLGGSLAYQPNLPRGATFIIRIPRLPPMP